jgi:hypothetical protein
MTVTVSPVNCQSVPLAMQNGNRRSGTLRSAATVLGVGWARHQSRCLNRFGSRAMFTALVNKGRQAPCASRR